MRNLLMGAAVGSYIDVADVFIEDKYSFLRYEGKVTFEDLDKEYFIEGASKTQFLAEWKEVGGEDFSTVLVMQEGTAVTCAIVVKTSDGWKLLQLYDVPKELKDILKNL